MTRIVYVPGGVGANVYDPGRDEIRLDEALRGYPVARQHILDHELEHAMNQDRPYSLLHDLKLELREDLFLYFSTSERAEAVRTYMRENHERSEREFLNFAGTVFANAIRELWQLPMMVLGAIYRRWLS